MLFQPAFTRLGHSNECSLCIPMNVPFTLRNKHPFPLMSQPAAPGALALPPPFRSATHAGLVLLTTTN